MHLSELFLPQNVDMSTLLRPDSQIVMENSRIKMPYLLSGSWLEFSGSHLRTLNIPHHHTCCVFWNLSTFYKAKCLEHCPHLRDKQHADGHGNRHWPAAVGPGCLWSQAGSATALLLASIFVSPSSRQSYTSAVNTLGRRVWGVQANLSDNGLYQGWI